MLSRAIINVVLMQYLFGRLSVQVFFSELTRTNIDSEAAYTWFALLCDIGGALGLILSCTVLTVCEFIDFFILQILIWIKFHATTVNVAH